MQIPVLRGREITDGDRQGTRPVAVVSDLFARTNFGDENPLGRLIEVGGSLQVDGTTSFWRLSGSPRPPDTAG